MILTEVQAEGWPDGEWQTLAARAVAVAIAASDYAGLVTVPAPIEVAIRLTSDAEVQALNRDYRGKDAPTNVLSFPMLEGEELDALITLFALSPELVEGLPFHAMSVEEQNNPSTGSGLRSGDQEIMLGDIILAHETCAREATEKNMPLEAHATHLIIHGTLHLLGYDHIDDEDATEMETLERSIMAGLGLHDPYED